MSLPLSRLPLWMRLYAIFLGVVILLWLPIEETTETTTLIFAIAISTWLTMAFLFRQQKPLQNLLRRYIWAGTFAGIIVTPLALMLMAFKTGLHSHQSPDFSTSQIISVIQRTPVWIIGGFLVGLGSKIWQASLQN